MESKSEKIARSFMAARSIGAVAGGYSMARIKRVQSFTAPTRGAALVHVEAILERGNYVRMKNVAGEFVVSEVVMA